MIKCVWVKAYSIISIVSKHFQLSAHTVSPHTHESPQQSANQNVLPWASTVMPLFEMQTSNVTRLLKRIRTTPIRLEQSALLNPALSSQKESRFPLLNNKGKIKPEYQMHSKQQYLRADCKRNQYGGIRAGNCKCSSTVKYFEASSRIDMELQQNLVYEMKNDMFSKSRS